MLVHVLLQMREPIVERAHGVAGPIRRRVTVGQLLELSERGPGFLVLGFQLLKFLSKPGSRDGLIATGRFQFPNRRENALVFFLCVSS